MTTRVLPPALLLLLGACTVGPNYAGPPTVAPLSGAAGGFVRAGADAPSPGPVVARWWEGLGDPTLTALVDDALRYSPTIDEAAARVREADAQLRQQRTGQLPSVSANATVLQAEIPGIDIGTQPGEPGVDSGGSSTSLTFYNLGLNAAWEVDLFGGGRRAVEGRRAGSEARRAALADAQVSLSAAVARAYVGLRDVQARIRLSADAATLQRRQLALVAQRERAGTASVLDVERLRTALGQTEAEAIPLAAQADEQLGLIAVLTGRAPGALDATLRPLAPVPLPPASVAVGDPAGLIARRPDIRAAERELAAGTATVAVNRARELPGVRFLGLLGLGGTRPGDVFDLSNLAALAAPSLNWSFLDFGRARAATAGSVAARDRLEATYRRTMLEALQEAEAALSRYGATRAQLGRLVRVEETAERAARLNRQRLDAGTTTLTDQLEVERGRLGAATAVVTARAQLTQAYIAVNKALGLGWADPVSAGAGPPSPAPAPRPPAPPPRPGS